jgi:Ca-activated chloride channel family protein
VGSSANKDMETLIEEKRKIWCVLTCLGYGMGITKTVNGNSSQQSTEIMRIDARHSRSQSFLSKEFKGSQVCVIQPKM